LTRHFKKNLKSYVSLKSEKRKVHIHERGSHRSPRAGLGVTVFTTEENAPPPPVTLGITASEVNVTVPTQLDRRHQAAPYGSQVVISRWRAASAAAAGGGGDDARRRAGPGDAAGRTAAAARRSDATSARWSSPSTASRRRPRRLRRETPTTTTRAPRDRAARRRARPSRRRRRPGRAG